MSEQVDVLVEEVETKRTLSQHWVVFWVSLCMSLLIIGLSPSSHETLRGTAYIISHLQTYLHAGFLVYLGVMCWSYYRLSQRLPLLNRLVSLLPFLMACLCVVLFFASPLFLTIGYLVVLYSYSLALDHKSPLHPNNFEEQMNYRKIVALILLSLWSSSLVMRYFIPLNITFASAS